MRVLIAEDEIISRRVLETTLAKWSYEVVVTWTGTEAWEILQRPDTPQLAILDWMMPGIDGIDICRRLRQRAQEPYVYILLLTARSRKEDVIVGLESGADDFLTKPFHPYELQARLPPTAHSIARKRMDGTASSWRPLGTSRQPAGTWDCERIHDCSRELKWSIAWEQSLSMRADLSSRADPFLQPWCCA